MLNGWYGIPVQLSIPVHSFISGKHIGKCRSFLKGRNFFSSSWRDTREIEYTLVPNTKGKPDLWKHFNLYASERQTAELMLMLLYVNSANIDIPLSNLLEAPKTHQRI